MALESEKRLYHFFRLLLSPLLKISIKIEVIGLENIPQSAAIITCNHRSDIDPSIISIAIPRYMSWIAADYMQQVPITSWMIKKTGMVLMNVAGKVAPSSLKQALKVLENGALLSIFPEGERYIFSNDFTAPLAEFHRGFALIAIKAQVPVVPVVICPVKEKLEAIKIPKSIRPYLARRYDLDKIKNIVRYKYVKVVIAPPILVDENRNIDSILSQTRLAMEAIQERYNSNATGK